MADRSDTGSAPADPARNAPAAGWTTLRTTVVTELLTAAIADLQAASGASSLRIVDAGGGTGGVGVPLAAAGHDVLVVDPSPDAMATLHRRAEERADGSAARIRGVQGDVADLPSLVPAGSVDVVVLHDVLDVVDDPHQALAAVRDVLRPGGLVSVVVAGRVGTAIARALAGRFEAAAALLDPGTPGPRYDVRSLPAALQSAGLDVVAIHGVRVFSDLVPGALLEHETGAASALLALERAAATHPDVHPIAARLHALAHRR
ncbi:MAG TPA: methyltransferase [Mycobacteriales bacterium]